MRFNDFKANKKLLKEADETKKVLTHLTHLEDTLFDEGYAGVEKAISFCELLRTTLAKGEGPVKKSIGVKIDGSPSVVFGIDPIDGQFFVGTKAAFSKNPKLMKSNADIQNTYGDVPDLANKMKYALKYLSTVGVTGIMQGDLLFTKNSLRNENINGKSCVVFEPNTIAYAAEVDSELGQKILKAKFGIAVHTIYHGTSMDNLQAEHGPAVVEAMSMLHPTSEVWIDDVSYKDYTGIASLTPQEDREIVRDMATCQRLANLIGKNSFNNVIRHPEIAKSIQIFMNSRVKSGELVGDTSKFINEFLKFYEAKLMAGIADLKGGPDSPAAKNRLKKVEDLKQFIIDNINTFVRVMEIYKMLMTMKLFFVHKLQKISSLGTFIRDEKGYRVTAPEGFVVVGQEGNTVKLVDRLNFSRENRLKHGE